MWSKCSARITEITTNGAFLLLFLSEVSYQFGCIHIKVFQRQIENIFGLFHILHHPCLQSPPTKTSAVSQCCQYEVWLDLGDRNSSCIPDILEMPLLFLYWLSLRPKERWGKWPNRCFAPSTPISMTIVIYSKAQRTFLLLSLLQPISWTPHEERKNLSCYC